MMLRRYWTLAEFAALIGISNGRLREAAHWGKCVFRRIGGTRIVDKYAFFTWYAFGGDKKLDEAFPHTAIAHDDIRRELEQFSAISKKGGCYKRIDHH